MWICFPQLFSMLAFLMPSAYLHRWYPPILFWETDPNTFWSTDKMLSVIDTPTLLSLPGRNSSPPKHWAPFGGAIPLSFYIFFSTHSHFQEHIRKWGRWVKMTKRANLLQCIHSCWSSLSLSSSTVSSVLPCCKRLVIAPSLASTITF